MTQHDQGNPQDHDIPARLIRQDLLRIFGLAALGLFISASIAGIYIDHLNRTQSYREIENMIHGVSNNIKMIMLSSLTPKKTYLEQVFDRIVLEPGIGRIHLVTNTSRISYSTDKTMIGRPYSGNPLPDCLDCHKPSNQASLTPKTVMTSHLPHQKLVRLSIPIYNSLECQKCHDGGQQVRGFVVAEFSNSFISSRLWNFRLGLAALLLTWMFLFSLLTQRLLLTFTFNPIKVVASRLAMLASGQFDLPASDQRPGGIIGFINEKIDATSLELKSVYDSLEARIEDQTRTLVESRKQLEEERNKITLLMENIPDSLLGIDQDGRICFANRKSSQLLGIPGDELAGRPIQSIPLLARYFRRCETSGQAAGQGIPFPPISVLEEKNKVLEFQAARISSPFGGQLSVLLILDRTEEVNLERNLARQERLAATGRLSAGIAHEIGNPLSAISSIIQIIQHDPGQGNMPHMLDLVNFHIERIGRIVLSLKNLAREGKTTLETVDLRTLLPRAMDITAYDPKAKGVDIKWHPSAEPCPLLCHPDEMIQLLMNIILNSLDALSGIPEPELTVTLSVGEGQTTISVQDNGCGIPPDNLTQIFEPFFTTKGVQMGTGLGLSVVYRAVKEIGGTIDVESTVGQGTTFILTFPGSQNHG